MEIRETIGKIAKLDTNTDNKVRGRFARLAVYINLDKPLISQVLINGKMQKVEYEFLSTVCFHCGRYGHTKELCSNGLSVSTPEKSNLTPEKLSRNLNQIDDGKDENAGSTFFGCW